MNFLPVTPYTSTTDLTDGTVTLKITKENFEGVKYQEGTIVLPFFSCRFNKLIIENLEDIDFKDISIAFFNCILDRLEIDNFITKNISISFLGSVVHAVIDSENITNVSFNNCLIPQSVFLTNVQSVNITFSKENVHLYRWKALFKKYNIGSYDDLLKQVHRYQISNVKRIHASSNYNVFSKSMRFKTSLAIYYENQSADLNTIITGLSLDSLAISGAPTGKVSIENTRINAWYVYDFSPQGDVSFYNIIPIAENSAASKIGFHRCNLDKVAFDNIAFDKYSIISFYRTKFAKAFFTACDFPETYKTFSKFVEIENVHYAEKRPKNYDKAQYEIFLQLKKATDETGNYYESQKLQAMAHDALKQIKTISWADRKILQISSWSNDHGLSITRPFLGFLLFSITIYLFYLLSIGRIFNCNDFDPNLIGYYFSFVDITHRSDFLVNSKKELTGWSLFLDYIGKLIVGFFIYQFIAAFRKYGKK